MPSYHRLGFVTLRLPTVDRHIDCRVNPDATAAAALGARLGCLQTDVLARPAAISARLTYDKAQAAISRAFVVRGDVPGVDAERVAQALQGDVGGVTAERGLRVGDRKRGPVTVALFKIRA